MADGMGEGAEDAIDDGNANSPGSGVRARLRAIMEGSRVQTFITAVILLNALLLGLMTSQTVEDAAGGVLGVIDDICLAIFVVELLLRLIAFGPAFFRTAWNVFDFVVVAISLLPASPGLSVLRALRVLRVLRLVTTMKSLRVVVQSLLRAVPGVTTIAGLLLLLFYVSGVIATNMFGGQFPQWFGSLGASLYSLFQIMTLESWSMGIVRPVLEEYPYAWAFFVTFILATNFTVLNLLIAVIVNAMGESEAAERETEEGHPGLSEHEIVMAELQSLRDEIRALKARD